jgi:hypothetical protein
MKVYWLYYKPVLWINLSTSLVFTLTDLSYLPFVFMTAGYIMSVFFASFFYRNTSFLYYNLGYSKLRLVFGAFLLNAVFSTMLLPLLWI